MSKDLHATKCRACLFPLNAATNIVPIFKEYKSTTLLAHMISETIHTMVDPSDNLGGNVCKLCAEKIYAFYEFRLSYLESEKKLREMLQNYEYNQRQPMASSSDPNPLPLPLPLPIPMPVGYSNSNIVGDVYSAQPNYITKSTMAEFPKRFECQECGRCFERELELKIHSHTHRKNDTPSQNNDSQNGFDDQLLIAHIKSEPIEYAAYDFNPLDWPDLSQSDVDNTFQDDDELRWKCTICDQRFLRRAHLRVHRREHAVDRSGTKSNDKKVKEERKLVATASAAATATATTTAETVAAAAATSTIAPTTSSSSSNSITIPIPQSKHDTGNLHLFKMNDNFNVSADAQFERWQCKRCFSTFRTRRLLRDHGVVHRNTSVATLDLESILNAAAASADSSSLINFDDDANGLDQLQVPPNNQPNASPKSHSTPLKSDGRWKCSKCKKVFETPKALRKHKQANHRFEIKLNLKSKNFVSERKNVSFDAMTARKKSLNVNRSPFVERDWPCNSCHQVFNRRSVLREHRRTVHMLKPTALPISMKHEQMDMFTAEEYAVAD